MLHRDGVITLLGDQYWVVGVRQLEALGVSRQSVDVAVRRGLVERVVRGVVGLPRHWETVEGRAMALHLAAHGRGFVSGVTAGRLHGLRRMPEVPVTYTLGQTTARMVVPSWGRLVRTSWPDDAPRPERPDTLAVASPLRTLFELAGTFGDRRFRRAAEDAWHLGLVTPDAAAAYLQRVRRRGRTGVARFERWLDAVGERPAASGLEQLLADLAVAAGLPEPVRQHPLQLRSGVTIHLDLAWPEVRFALEPGHSWWHGGDRAQRLDQDRDRQCAELGWMVARFDETVWRRRSLVTEQIGRMYRARRADLLAS